MSDHHFLRRHTGFAIVMPARVREFFTYGTGYPSPRDLRPSPREEEEATEPVTGRRRLGQCPRNRDTSCTVRAGQGTTARIFADRKSTRLNSSHVAISYAVFCLKNIILECRQHCVLSRRSI